MSTTTDWDAVRAAIRRKIETSGLSQRAFCVAADVDQGTLSGFLAGKRPGLSDETLRKLGVRATPGSADERVAPQAEADGMPSERRSPEGASATDPETNPGEEGDAARDSLLITVPLDRLFRWEGNPRPASEHDTEQLVLLAESIASEGVLQPLIGRRTAGSAIEIIAGGRRLAALQRLRHEGRWPDEATVPVRLLPGAADDLAALRAAIAENIQREAMHPLDEGRAFAALRAAAGEAAVSKKAKRAAEGEEVRAIAADLHKSERWVQGRIALATRLDSEVQELLRRGPERGGITLAVAEAFLAGTPSQQREAMAQLGSNFSRDPVKWNESATRSWIEYIVRREREDAARAAEPARTVPPAGGQGTAPHDAAGDDEVDLDDDEAPLPPFGAAAPAARTTPAVSAEVQAARAEAVAAHAAAMDAIRAHPNRAVAAAIVGATIDAIGFTDDTPAGVRAVHRNNALHFCRSGEEVISDVAEACESHGLADAAAALRGLIDGDTHRTPAAGEAVLVVDAIAGLSARAQLDMLIRLFIAPEPTKEIKPWSSVKGLTDETAELNALAAFVAGTTTTPAKEPAHG